MTMIRRLVALVGLCGVALVVNGQSLKESVTYYQGCESLKPSYEGESVHPSPVLQPGKIGKAFLIERRLFGNLIGDPDFKGDSEAWLSIGQPAFVKEGGFADPNCVVITDKDYVRQAVLGLQEHTLYCFSVYARSAEGGSLELAVKSGANSKQFQSRPLAADYTRHKLSLVADGSSATITIKATSAQKVHVDAAQLEPGKSWPSAFWPQATTFSPVQWVDIPATTISPMKGSVAFWLKPQWLGEESTGGFSFFAAAKEFTAYKDQKNAISIGAYRRPGKHGWENGFNITFIDKSGGRYGYTPVEWDARFKPDEWLHWVVTWDIKPGGESYSCCYLNGQKAGDLKFLSDSIEPPAKAQMGYSGGAYADSVMDEFYLFSRPVTAQEAMELHSLRARLR